ncbi:MFS transporter [Paenibacillus sp. HN-1]|uniref:MFS transporter n=1 Tax=Paenibacillus TaxID=44249 RepID=UPI001CA8AEC9|nr:MULTISPECIES: MFS transporter [Paenibacillus]MBY9078130.1 MFS transporter [Paenibacillus sp. CGMCC 1.18879]MBY9083871.1 MFS transporter [Paenibacillus sinensis]
MSNNLKIYMLAFITFMTATTEFIIAGILDKVADSVNIPVAAAGQLITVFAIANAIGSPIVMMSTARVDRRHLLMLALGILVIGSVMTITLPGFGFLILSRIMLAVGTGVFGTIAKTYASQLASPERRAGAIATVITGSSAALIIGVPIGRVVASIYDWKVIFWGIGLFSLLAIFAVSRTIPSSKEAETVPLKNQLALLKEPKIFTGLLVTFFWQLGYAALFAYIAPFLLTIHHMSEREVSLSLFAFGIATLIGSKSGGYLTDRLGIHRTLLGSLTVHVLALLLLSTISGSVFVTVPLLMLWAFAAWSSGPGLQYNLIVTAPNAAGIMLSLFGSVLQLSIAAAAGIGGIAASGSSMLAISWTGAVSVAVALGIAAVAFSRSRSLPLSSKSEAS